MINEIEITEQDMRDRISKLEKEYKKQKNKETKKIIKNQIKYWQKRIDANNRLEDLRSDEEVSYKSLNEIEGYTPYELGYIAVGGYVIKNKK